MIDKEKVLSFVKQRGPVLPRDVSREFGGDTFITGAVLSQLTDNKELRISHAKIGGSPVYYASGQEDKLSLLYKYLPGKEKEAYDLLKNKKIMRDSFADPAIRVALRSIKDFAKALEVNIGENKEVFWKWYLISNADAENIIRQILSLKKKEEENIKENEEITEEKKEELKEKIEMKGVEQKTQKESEKKEKQEKLQKETIKREEEDLLLSKIKKVFDEKKIEVIESKVIRKNSDIEFLVNISSPVGKLKYFCKVRDKKKSNDKDLSSVYVQGQIKKLPVLYITTGQLTKKAEEMLEKEFKMVSILYI